MLIVQPEMKLGCGEIRKKRIQAPVLPSMVLVNIDEKDIKLDYCVSPEKIFNFL